MESKSTILYYEITTATKSDESGEKKQKSQLRRSTDPPAISKMN